MAITSSHNILWRTHGRFNNQSPSAGQRRGRYSDAFKAEIVAACMAPGISTVAVALANSLNANLVRRWVLESDPLHKAVR